MQFFAQRQFDPLLLYLHYPHNMVKDEQYEEKSIIPSQESSFTSQQSNTSEVYRSSGIQPSYRDHVTSEKKSPILASQSTATVRLPPVHTILDNTYSKIRAEAVASAQTETRPIVQPPTLTSSERGKRFRAQKQRETSQLITTVGLLKGTISELTQVRNHLRRSATELQKAYKAKCNDYVRHCMTILCDLRLNPNFSNSHHIEYLHQMMADDITHTKLSNGTQQHGIQSLIAEWSAFSSKFGQLVLIPGEVNTIQSSPQLLIQTNYILVLELSMDTLIAFFPHILHQDNMIQMLIGLNISVSMKQQYLFNEDAKCISLTTRLELLAGFAEALGSIELALDLLQQSYFQFSIEEHDN